MNKPPNPSCIMCAGTGKYSNCEMCRGTGKYYIYSTLIDCECMKDTEDSLRTRIAALEAGLREAMETMVMQEKRESGEFHINNPTAVHIWNTTKANIKRLLGGEGE